MKKIVIIVLAIINSVFLVMILISVLTGWRIASAPSENKKIIADSSVSNSDDASYDSENDYDDENDDYDDNDDENSYANDDGEYDDDNDFVAGAIVDDDIDDEVSIDPETTHTESSAVSEPSKQTQVSKPQSSKPDQTSKPQSSTPTQASKPQSSTPTQTSKPASQTSSLPSSQNFSTTAKAGIMDAEGFSWNKGWTYLSSNAKPVSNFSELTGGWKAIMISDPLELMDSYATDYMNVDITGSASSLTVTMNWGTRIAKQLGTVDASGSSSSMTGSYSNGEITAVGSGRITINSFCYDYGKEFAVGTYTWPDGVIGYIGLIRP